MRAPSAVAFLFAACASPESPSPADGEHFFYRPRDLGSEATYDPLASSLQYGLDSLQIQDFGTDDYGEHLETVLRHLGSPFHAIENEGGLRRFVNTEIFPVDPDNLEDSLAILPNLALHAFGGGLLYRKDAEWFEAHGVAEPYVVSATLAMITEVLAEAVEKPVTEDTDEVADVLIYRPLGIWLFSDDDRARWIQRELDPVAWPSMLMWSIEDSEFVNTGVNYVVRPGGLGEEETRPFLQLGLTSLVGLSHPTGDGEAFSWGVGASTVTSKPVEVRGSGALYYEREGSLLASLVFNGGEGYAVRANLYPGPWFNRSLGVFAAVADDGEVAAGIQYRLPVGVAR